MKRKEIIILAASAFLLLSCSSNKTDTSNIKSHAAVTITRICYGTIPNEIQLTGTTVYEDKSTITAPIQAYISNAYIQPGSRVSRNKILYILESKEHRALGNDTSIPTSGYIPLKASSSGVVTSVMQQTGSYVPEGTPLCTIANLNSMVFELNVPYEQHRYVSPGKHCVIVLPDNTHLDATIGTSLASMNINSQVQQIVARAKAPFLPEGMTVKVIINTGSGAKRIIAPKQAVQSNETLTEYWVMKLVNDSTVAKVPVTIGNSSTSDIEIYSPSLSINDRIVLTGGYGLEDHANIHIIHNGL